MDVQDTLKQHLFLANNYGVGGFAHVYIQSGGPNREQLLRYTP